jgi:Acetyltransferase (GNAT) domain
MEVTTRFLSEDEYPRWAGLVAASPDGSPYSLPAYLDALCAATGARFRILVAERDAKIVGGIALYERRSRLGSYLSPRLLMYYNGLVLVPHEAKYPSSVSSWQLQTLAALERALSALGLAHIKLRSRSTLADLRMFQSRGWSSVPSYSYVVDISNLAAAWDRVDKNLRRLVTRCTEQGLVLTEDGDFESFHRMHVQTHDRKRAPLYLPRDAFVAFVARLRTEGLARLYHARLPDGRSIASQLVLLGAHPVTHTASAAADAEFLSTGASAFLRWRVFEQLSAEGYRANDLTDAELNPVTHFKSQLGGDLVLNLTVSRPSGVVWRTGEFAGALPMRIKRRVLTIARAARARRP